MKTDDKKPTGVRDIEYTSKHLEKARQYLDNWRAHGTVPQIARLAIHCGISRQTLYKWEKIEKCKDFADICARVRVLQEAELIDSGLTREFDSSLSKLMLMKHGYSDKQSIDHTTKGEAMQSISPHQFVKPENES